MRHVLAFSFIVLMAAQPVMAQPYCAMYSDGTRTCGIPTLQSCEQSVSGVGGDCSVDDSAELAPPIKGPIEKWIERQESDGRPHSPALDDVPPPPGN